MSTEPMWKKFIPDEYLVHSKIITVIILLTLCIYSVSTIISQNKSSNHKKSIIVVLIMNVFLSYFLYGVLFINTFTSVVIGISFLISLLCCFIHWRSSRCKDFVHFFAVKSGWITAVIPLLLSSYFVGAIKNDFWERVFVLLIGTSLLLLPCLVYSLIKYKIYYKPKSSKSTQKTTTPKTTTPKTTTPKTTTPKTTTPKTTTPKTTTPKTTTPKTTTPKTTTPKTTTPKTTTPKTTTPKTTTPKTTTPKTTTPKTTTPKTTTPKTTTPKFNTQSKPSLEPKNPASSVINEAIPIKTKEHNDLTLDVSTMPVSTITDCDFEKSLRNQLISSACGYIKLYLERKKEEELVGDIDSVKKLRFFSPTDFEEIKIDINTNYESPVIRKEKQGEEFNTEKTASLVLDELSSQNEASSCKEATIALDESSSQNGKEATIVLEENTSGELILVTNEDKK